MLCRASLVSSCTNSGEGAGGFSTITCALACVFSPRESLQLAFTMIAPAAAPEVFRAALFPPVPDTLPPLVRQSPTVTATLSGLLHLQRMVEGVPVSTVGGFAEHEIAGGFFGGSFTMKAAMQWASPPFFLSGSEICEIGRAS